MSRRRRSSSAISVWPGFVDALSALLMLVIFMLLIYTLTQLYLSQTLSDRDSELARLNTRLAEISRLLRLEEERAEMLEQELGVVQEALGISRGREEILQTEVDRLEDQAEMDRDRLMVLLGTQASLQQDISALRELRAQLEEEIAGMSSLLAQRDATIGDLEEDLGEALGQVGALRDRSMALQARIADERERTLLAQQEIDEQEIRLQDLMALVDEGQTALDEEQTLSASQRAQINRLNEQIEALQAQLRTISAALRLQETVTQTQEAELADLGQRLNTLLAQRVSELEQYQSEFFRQLREALADRDDIRIIGDRFLLPSELLFSTGSATIGEAGLEELDKLVDLVLELTETIPDDVEWILRVDGHTDAIPISTVRFPSNWELSTARAVSVVRYLADQGVPQERMAATGFGEHQPIETGFTADALQANRRIELKLTNR
ncbi:MAG: peptidoglycan-binding protein [Natronospirillum sp.]|uniref:peptidoglycan-binding protein n=1 Tax=Natronospirillum sp. TaxID=2812955 RepID=UPI0025F30897|nr:peptidoglycan-binding protein [Natronospirillum sp.]MCH8552141.1 peptidoglycan-binding protein [Natronospirillum sp.]